MPDILVVALERNRIINESLDNSEVVNKFQILADTIIHIINEAFNFFETEQLPSAAWLFIENEALNFVEFINHVRNVAEDFLVKIIEEVLNLPEILDHVLGVELGEVLVKVFTEMINLVESKLTVIAIVRQFVNRFQISETIDQNKLFSKVIDDVLNFVETRNEFVIGVTIEIVKIVADIMTFVESTLPAFGITVIVNETLSLLDSVLGIVYIIGQVIMKFVTGIAVKATFWFNRDVEQ